MGLNSDTAFLLKSHEACLTILARDSLRDLLAGLVPTNRIFDAEVGSHVIEMPQDFILKDFT